MCQCAHPENNPERAHLHLSLCWNVPVSMLRKGTDDTASTPQDAHAGARIDVEVKRASKTVTKWKSNTSASNLALVNGVRQTSDVTDGEAPGVIHWPIWRVSACVSRVEAHPPFTRVTRAADPFKHTWQKTVRLTLNTPTEPGGLCVLFKDPSTTS